MVEFEIGGHEYRIGKLTAFQQLHVSRRIAPLLPGIAPLFMKYSQMLQQIEAEGGQLGSPEARFSSLRISAEEIGEIAQPLLEALSSMKDADFEFVVGTCLSAVKRLGPAGHWADFWNSQAKRCAFHDAEDMVLFLQLTVRCITANLGNSIAALTAIAPGGARTTQKTPPGDPFRAAKSTS